MQSRLPKIKKNSLDHSTDRQRTRSRAGYQLHQQQLSSHPANTAGGKNHSHIQVRWVRSLPKQKQKRDVTVWQVDFQYKNKF